MRYKIELSYDGADFCGWQVQPHDPSVQEVLERTLGTLLREHVQVTGAGRTDTGVNASYYVAHFDFDAPVPEPLADAGGSLDCGQLRFKLNAILPVSISVLRVSPAAPDFNARFDAVRRQYTYYLHRCKDPFCERYSYFYAYPEVDFEAMNRAAAALLGTHDFSCFEKTGGDNKTSVCTVFSARWEQYTPVIYPSRPTETEAGGVGGYAPRPLGVQGDNKVLPVAACGYYRFIIEADRFLRNMVRAIVGTLLEVGRGRRSEDDFASLVLPAETEEQGPALLSRSGAAARMDVAGSCSSATAAHQQRVSRRSAAGESVPGHALFLSDIEYRR